MQKGSGAEKSHCKFPRTHHANYGITVWQIHAVGKLSFSGIREADDLQT